MGCDVLHRARTATRHPDPRLKNIGRVDHDQQTRAGRATPKHDHGPADHHDKARDPHDRPASAATPTTCPHATHPDPSPPANRWIEAKGFIKDGPKNRLRSQDIHKIVDVFNKQTEIDRYSRMVPMTEIAAPKNDFNLNIQRYIDSSEPEDFQDLHAHLHGGIPDRDIDALADFWEAFPSLRKKLFTANRPGYSDLAIEVAMVQQTVLDSAEFKKFAADVHNKISDWFGDHRGELLAIDANTRPSDLITRLGDDLLARVKPAVLLDEYDIYEQLMSYWHSTMHDDVFLVMNEGWVAAAKPRKAIEDKDRKLSETPDLVIGSGRSATKYKMDLIPPHLVVARYLADEQLNLDELNALADEATRAVEEYIEEHAVEDGLLFEAMDDDKLSKALAAARLKEARSEGSDPDEVKALEHVLGLYAAETSAKKTAKDAQAELDLASLKKYGELSVDDCKQLVLDAKWNVTVAGRAANEVNSLSLDLVDRVQELGERYAETVEELDGALSDVEAKVIAHLAEMGVK